MPADLTIFAATYLVFIEGVLAVAALALVFYRQPRSGLVRRAVTAALILVLSYVFAQIGGAVYNDPRPFTQDHVKPLIAHAPDNGFPSDHALLAAALVALVAVAGSWLAIPVAVLAVLVDWARVGTGIHHVADVVGSSLCIALATLIALAVAPTVVRWISPYVPRALSGAMSVSAEPRSPDRGGP
jgi:undecaprenyl-diphosphatase